eukprot:5036636-Lingulodinium_polyedra.AAC.1
MAAPSLGQPAAQLLGGGLLPLKRGMRALPHSVVDVVHLRLAVLAALVHVVAAALELLGRPVGIAEHRSQDALVLALRVPRLQQ